MVAKNDRQTIDAELLCALVRAGLARLEQHKEAVNALNVFPVPDGDTGTNMVLTMRAACNSIDGLDNAELKHVLAEFARGALMGARGNSGVILSQIWQGFSISAGEQTALDCCGFAQGLQVSAETAFNSVQNPVEGTILSVIDAMANSAEMHAPTSPSLAALFEKILAAGQKALANTPNQLPILKQAGVVDSGGQGLVYIFSGMHALLTGEITAETPAKTVAQISPQALAQPNHDTIKNPYDVQFILQSEQLDLADLRAQISAMGDSALIVGDSQTVKVHVHVEDPGQPISYGASLGRLSDVVVENMQMQMEEKVNQKPDFGRNLTHTLTKDKRADQIGLIATSPGEGITNALIELGVNIAINGGQSNNPSTEEFYAAINALPNEQIIILPNNKNIKMAAEIAADLSHKAVRIVRTNSVPQGIAALIAFNPNSDLEAVFATMQDAAQEIATGEITTAVRNVKIDGIVVQEGELIGLVNGKLVAAGATLAMILPALFDALQLADCELMTIYYGQTVSHKEAIQLAQMIEASYPAVSVDLLSGGQAHYDYIFGAE